MNLVEMFLILYVSIGFIFIFLGTWYFGSKKVVETISPRISLKTSAMLHHVVFFTMILGFLLPKPLLKYHILAILIGFLHWQTNDEKCILTEIHRKLLNYPEYSFFKDTIFQNKISSSQAFYISYLVFFISLCFSLWRLGLEIK